VNELSAQGTGPDGGRGQVVKGAFVVDCTDVHVRCVQGVLRSKAQGQSPALMALEFVKLIREFKKLLRRRQGLRRLKSEFIFYLRILRYILKSFTLLITVKTITKLNLGHCYKFEIEIYKLSRCGSRSSNYAEFGHFTLFFRRGR